MATVPMQTQQCTDDDLRCNGTAERDESKVDEILRLLKAEANPKASPISNVGSAEADAILLELGFLQEDGNKAYPIVVPAEAPECSSFDYSQFSSKGNGTPQLLKHHQNQLTKFGVQFGRSHFEIHDVHTRRDLKLLLPSGTLYYGGLDGIVASWGLTKAGAVTEMRIAYEHKQSAAQKRLYREAHPEDLEVDLLLHPCHSASSGKILPSLFHHSCSAWKGFATTIQNGWLARVVQLAGRAKCGRMWLVLHGHKLILPTHLVPLQCRATSQSLMMSKQHLPAGAKGNVLLHFWLLVQ